MTSNVYTKNEIIQKMASNGCFVDMNKLDSLLLKWNIEAIFEDEQGSEFFDKNMLDIAIDNYITTSQAQNNVQNFNQNISQPQQNIQNNSYTIIYQIFFLYFTILNHLFY